MSSLRAQLSTQPAPAAVPPAESKAPEPVREVRQEPPREAAKEPANEEAKLPRRGLGMLVFAGVIAAFWAGSASAFLRGYFEAQGIALFGGLGLEMVSFAAIVVFLPPFLFIAAAYALSRAQTMSDTARRLATVSEKLTTADESAIQSAQKLGRAVRRELDALSSGLDTAFGRLRVLEKTLEERVADLEDASARAGVKADIIAQHLHAQREGIDLLAKRLEEASQNAAQTLATRVAELKTTIDASSGALMAVSANAAEALSDKTTVLKGVIDSAGGVLMATSAHAAEALSDRTTELKGAIESAGGEIRHASVFATEMLTSKTAQLKAMIESAGGEIKDASGQAAETLAGKTVQLKGMIETASGEIRNASIHAAETLAGKTSQLKAMVELAGTQIRDASALAAETLSGRAAQLQASVETAGSDMRDAATRAAESLASRAAQLKSMIETAGTDIRAAAQSLEAQAAQFKESVEKAAAAPHSAAIELDRQAKQITTSADTAVARAEFVLARQERQRGAMNDLLSRLKEETSAFDAILDAQYKAAEKAASALTLAAKQLEEMSDQGMRRVDAAMANTAARSTQLSASFGRDAERVKETAEISAASIQRLVLSLGEAAESARALIAGTTQDSERRSKNMVGEAMAECDRLLRATASVAEEAEKARASIAQATEEAQQHMASLPAVAAKEAEKVREAVRSETEQMLDTSARTLTTLQTRIAAKRPVAPAAQAPEEPAQAEAPSQPESMGDGLRGLARRITAPKRKGDERGRGSFELSDVLAAAEAREPSKAGLKQGAAASLGALQAALADLAGELIELVGETADPALWRRYLEGDRAVFARRLASSIGPESINRVTTLYRDNPRFHEAADNYLSEFEMLLTRARESDRDGFLASTLLTADTGKIYLAIAYALGRLD